ncbi:MAG: DUF1552 domain-containing protein [Gemmataceae bacterium]
MLASRKNWSLTRRTFLRGAGVALALPWLEATGLRSRGQDARPAPRRSVFCFWGLGLNGRDFTPTKIGRDFEVTPILKPLDPWRAQCTVISGLKLTHSGGHEGDRTFLTGTASHRPGTKLRISVDQELSEWLGQQTRFPSLSLGIQRGTGFGSPQDHTLSWSRRGTPIPAENRPHVLFDRLFRKEDAAAITRREASFQQQSSVLDAVRGEAKQLADRLGKDDRERLEEYFNSVRDVEKRIDTDRAWLNRPKPDVRAPEFGSDTQALDPSASGRAARAFEYRRYQRLMYDVIALALQTDSTRVIAYMARQDLRDGTHCYSHLGNPYGYHEMTHHGEDADKLKWLTRVDTWYMEDWAYFLDRLHSVKEGAGTLLDHTMVIWGSSGGTINAHNNHHLPTILCGGSRLGIKHQGHIRQEGVLLGNLWQTVVDRMGMPVPENFQGGEASGLIKELI